MAVAERTIRYVTGGCCTNAKVVMNFSNNCSQLLDKSSAMMIAFELCKVEQDECRTIL